MSERSVAIKSSIDASIDGADPDWMHYYEMLYRILLEKQHYVEGGDFKKFCLRRGLWLPDTHNRWVGGPEHLRRLGWVERVQYVEPTTAHSHIGYLTLWRSLIFSEDALHTNCFVLDDTFSA